MSDDTKKTVDPAQDPLAVLENILKDAKSQSGNTPPTNGTKTEDESLSPQPTESEKIATEEKKKKEALASEEERQKQVEKYRQEMQGVIEQTDAYQARLSQDDEEKKDKSSSASADGFDIKQLEHKKI